MSKSIKLLLLIALLGASVTACTGVKAAPNSEAQHAPMSTAQTGKAVELLEIELKATLEVPAELLSGEAVKLRFTLINNADTSLYVLKWYTPLEGLGGEIFRVERDGRVVPYKGPLAYRAVPTPDAYVLLDAGESVSAAVDLARAYDLTKAGEYTIGFISPRISHVARTEAEMAKTMDDLGPVQIPSNWISVKITSSSDLSVRRTPTEAAERPYRAKQTRSWVPSRGGDRAVERCSIIVCRF